jgi:hypothetical protein
MDTFYMHHQGGGAVWRGSSIDSRPGKAYALILPEDGSVENSGGDF